MYRMSGILKLNAVTIAMGSAWLRVPKWQPRVSLVTKSILLDYLSGSIS